MINTIKNVSCECSKSSKTCSGLFQKEAFLEIWRSLLLTGVAGLQSTIFSSNINEVIRAILDFFIQKFHNHKKAQNAYKQTKTKNAPKKEFKTALITSFILLLNF